MSGIAELKLSAPRGPVRAKYELFRWLGEPGWPRNYQEIWAIGDVGTGKTSALIDSIFYSIYYYPGARVCVVRSTLVELQSSLVPDMQKRLAPLFENEFLDYIRDMGVIRAANGSEIHLFGLDTADNKLWGQQWFRAFVDQGERVKPNMLDLLHTRVRLQVWHKDTRELGTTYIKITANWDRGRDWVYKRVVDGSRALDRNGDVLEKVKSDSVAGRKVESRILAIFSRTEENEELSEDYFRHLILAGKVGSRAVRGGYDKGDDEGLVFVEYSNRNVIDFQPDINDRPIYVGLDHGVHHPTVALFFVKDGNRYIAIREYIRRNASAYQNAEAVAEIIYSLWEQGASRFFVYADPSMWARNAMDAELSSVASVYERSFSEMGIPVYFSPAFGRRKTLPNLPRASSQGASIEFGIGVIKQLLREGRLYINPRLTPRLDEMLAEITYDDIHGDTMTKVDVFDAARYALMNARLSVDGDGDEVYMMPVVDYSRRMYD